MKKIFYILCITMLLTGCNVKYNVELNNDIFHEEINFNIDSNVDGYNYLKEQEPFANIETKQLYIKNIMDNKISLVYDYKGTKYKKSRVFNQCFDNYNVVFEDNKYYIGANGEFKCLVLDYFTADYIEINFITNYLVVSNNASKVEDNKYTWIVNKNNYKDFSIDLIVDTTKKNKQEPGIGQSLVGVAIILGIIVGVILLVILIIKIISSIKNKI